jgi:hypothetical protein
MSNARVLTLLAVLGLAGALLPACQTTGLVPTPDTGGSDAGTTDDTNTDTGPMAQRTLSYTPDGCSYTVSTPTVSSTGRSMDAFGAAATPTHVHASFAGATDTTFAVNWHTDNDTLASSMLIGTDMAAVMAADGATTGVDRHDGHFMLFTSSPAGDNPEMGHEVHVCGLTADTTYYYRVGGPGHWSDVFSFATGPAIGSTATWTFAATGDSRGYEDNAWSITQHRLQTRGVDLEVFSGDAVVLGTVQSQWNQFFEQVDGAFGVQDYLASHAFMPANGNHDALAVNYIAQFALPQDVSMNELGTGEQWYSFDYANAHFVMLDDQSASQANIAGPEAMWLEQDLMHVDRARTPWIFVVHHAPFYTCSTHAPLTSTMAAWEPIFERYHVDFVLAGHNHVYERSRPIYQFMGGTGSVAPQGPNGAPQISGGVPSGTVYLVSAGVGAPLYNVMTDPSTCPLGYVGMMVRPYVTFEIQDRAIHMRAFDAMTDAMIDELTYTK